jgi:hypothetical protein
MLQAEATGGLLAGVVQNHSATPVPKPSKPSPEDYEDITCRKSTPCFTRLADVAISQRQGLILLAFTRIRRLSEDADEIRVHHPEMRPGVLGQPETGCASCRNQVLGTCSGSRPHYGTGNQLYGQMATPRTI